MEPCQWAATWFFEHRREQRADAKDRGALKAAARIAYTDMGVIRRNLRVTLKHNYWAGFMTLPTAGWQQQGDRLAAELPAADYESVAHAFARAADLERGFETFLRPNSPHRGFTKEGVEVVPLKDETKTSVEDVLEQADAACQILGAMAHADDK